VNVPGPDVSGRKTVRRCYLISEFLLLFADLVSFAASRADWRYLAREGAKAEMREGNIVRTNSKKS
jgi:hypothetical protein